MRLLKDASFFLSLSLSLFFSFPFHQQFFFMSSNNNNNKPSTSTTRQRKPRLSAQKRAGIHFPVSRITQFFRKGGYASRYSVKASVYMAAVLEYLASEMVELAGCITLDEKKVIISPEHILSGIQNDVALNQLMSDAPGGTHITGAGWVKPFPESSTKKNNS